MNRERDQKLDALLQRAFGPLSISASQRKRYQRLLLEQKNEEMEFLRRNLAELGVLVAALLVVIGVAMWHLDPFDSDDHAAQGFSSLSTEISEPDVSVTSAVTTDPVDTTDVAAIAEANGCHITPLADTQPRSFWNDEVWYENNNMRASPRSTTFMLKYATWYTDETGIALQWDGANPLELSGRALDGTDTPVVFGWVPPEPPAAAEIATVILGPTVFTTVEFPRPGCYEINAVSGDESATFTVYVLPHADRPDIKAVAQIRAATLPYPIPESCHVTAWSGPMEMPGVPAASYWLEGSGLAARAGTGPVTRSDLTGVDFGGGTDLLFVGENKLDWYLDDWAPLQITGHLLDDPTRTLDTTLARTSGLGGEHWDSTLFFPASGCWEIEASAGSQTLNATVYVYPSQ